MRRFYVSPGLWRGKLRGKTMSDSRLVATLPTKRAVIYARFSTDLQNERSIEDQVLLCRRYAVHEDMDIVEVYQDRARSGGSIMGRDGLLRLLDRARDRAFDVVIVEALDRLSRDMEDLAGIHKRLSFFGIENPSHPRRGCQYRPRWPSRAGRPTLSRGQCAQSAKRPSWADHSGSPRGWVDLRLRSRSRTAG